MKSVSFLRMACAALVIGLLVASANADVASAKKKLDEAKEWLKGDNFDAAVENVKLAELELDGVADAEKKPIQAELDTIKTQAAERKKAKFKDGYLQSATRIVENAKRELVSEDYNGVNRSANSLAMYFERNEVKEMLTAEEIKNLQTQMDKLKASSDAKVQERVIGEKENEIGRIETEYAEKVKEIKSPDSSPGTIQGNIRDINNTLTTFSSRLKDLPADNPKIKAIQARVDKMNADFQTVYKGQASREKLESLKSFWEGYSNDYGGWEQEKDNLPIARLNESNTDVWAFMMPKTKNLISRADSYLENLDKDESYKEVKSEPAIKAYVDGIVASRKTAYDKMLKNVTGVVDQVEKLTYTNDNIGILNSMSDNIRNALGEKSPDAPVLMARVQKLKDNYDAGLKAADKAFEDNYVKMKEQAAKAWPDMAAKFKITEGFDPNKYKDFTGKTVKITTDNLMGRNFKLGDFPFATTLNGLPVACRYHPEVAAAVKDVEAKVKHGLGNIDEDGRWEIIATVDGTTGQMMTRQTVEGEVRSSSGGQRLGTYAEEKSEAVQAPILTIVAAKCGPLAVAAGQGAVTESGAIATPAGVTSSGAAIATGAGTFRRLFVLLVGLIAAAAALMKAGYAPLTSIPQAGAVQAKLGGDNLAYIGLACAALGTIWLITGLIIYGLAVNLAIIAAGVYAAHEFLAAKGILKPDMVAKLKPLGVPIGLACAAIVVLSLFTGGSLWIL